MARWSDIGAGLLLAVGTLLVFRDPLLAMVAQWDMNPMYSYGYVVPFISGYLLWSRKEQLAHRAVTPSRLWGGVVILGSLTTLAIARVNAIQVLEQLSFVSTIAGIVLLVFGRSWLMVTAPAIGYLLFMVPLWDAFTEPLHWPFQLNSAKLGVSMMQAIGVPVYREGTIIALPNLVIEVARECSGVNYLVAVLALALPMAFLRLDQNWRRVMLIGSALTVAALANSLRVALIGTLAYYEVGSPLHGPFHVLHGLFVAGIGFVVIFVGLRVLEGPGVETRAVKPVEPTKADFGWRLRDVVGLTIVFWTLAFVGVTPQAREVELVRPLEDLPRNLGKWTAQAESPPNAASAPTGIASAWGTADRQLSRLYRSEAGRTASVEIYYFAMQRQGQEIISNTAADLHRNASEIAISEGQGFRFVANLVEFPEQKQAGLFWYDTGGRTAAGRVATKLATMWRALLRGQTNGAAIVLRTTNDARALDDLRDLASELRPALGGLWTQAGSY
jgi:EpsI family protein